MRFALNSELIRRRWPPLGGWIYHETATGWVAPSPMSDNFDSTVDKIIRHRMANRSYGLSVDRLDVELELMHQTAVRIMEVAPEHTAKWVVAIDEEAQKKKDSFRNTTPEAQDGRGAQAASPSAGHDRGVLRRALSLANGARILSRWIGSGHVPVSDVEASRRAAICEVCPLNQPGDWFDRVTGAIADSVREEITAKSALNLRVPNEDKMGTCYACGCNLRLKVWVPLPVITERTTQEELDELHPNCWIRNAA